MHVVLANHLGDLNKTLNNIRTFTDGSFPEPVVPSYLKKAGYKYENTSTRAPRCKGTLYGIRAMPYNSTALASGTFVESIYSDLFL